MASVFLTPNIGTRSVEMVSALTGNIIEIGAPSPAQAVKMAQVVQGPAGPAGPAGPSGTASFPHAITAGGPSAFTATLGLASLATPVVVSLTFNTAPAAGATLSPDGLGPVPILAQDGSAIGAGAVLPGLLQLWRISASGAQPFSMG